MEIRNDIVKLEITTRNSKLDIFKEELTKIGIFGLSVVNIIGRGKDKANEVYRNTVVESGLIPKIRIEILTETKNVEQIIAISQKILKTGKPGDGKIVILPVIDIVRVRTGERGIDAIK